jgi:transposase-like protein
MSRSNNYRWTETYARKTLERARARGLSDSELARELGVSPQRVYWWRKRLHGAQTPREAAFVEVKLAAPVQEHAAPAQTLAASRQNPFAIHTANGRTIEVWAGFDAAELARLLAAVEKAC